MGEMNMQESLLEKIDPAWQAPPKDCLFRILKSGGRVLWQITNTCNYTCGYCIFSSGAFKDAKELTKEDIFRVLVELKTENFSYIKLTGGEPFVRRDLLDILDRVSSLGFAWDLSTNGSPITNKIAAQLSKFAPDYIHVSLDGPDSKSHEAVRGRGTFAPTLSGIERLCAFGVPVRIGCVLHRDNETHIKKMCGLASKLGVKELVFSVMEPLGRMQGDYSQYIKRSLLDLKRDITVAASENSSTLRIRANFTAPKSAAKSTQESCGTCPGGAGFLFIDHLGFVSPCTWGPGASKEYKSKSGLKTTPLRTILGIGAIAEYRNFILKSNHEGKSGCPTNW